MKEKKRCIIRSWFRDGEHDQHVGSGDAPIAVHVVAASCSAPEVLQQDEQVGDADQSVGVEVSKALIDFLEGEALLQHLWILTICSPSLKVHCQADFTFGGQLCDQHLSIRVRESCGLQIGVNEDRAAIHIVRDQVAT